MARLRLSGSIAAWAGGGFDRVPGPARDGWEVSEGGGFRVLAPGVLVPIDGGSPRCAGRRFWPQGCWWRWTGELRTAGLSAFSLRIIAPIVGASPQCAGSADHCRWIAAWAGVNLLPERFRTTDGGASPHGRGKLMPSSGGCPEIAGVDLRLGGNGRVLAEDTVSLEGVSPRAAGEPAVSDSAFVASRVDLRSGG